MKLRLHHGLGRGAMVFAAFSLVCLAACGHSSSSETGAPATAAPQAATFPPAPAPETTGGFDGARAYKHVEQLVAIGPHSAGSEGIRRAQEYIVGQLKSFGCPVEEESFHAPSTPVGDVAMKNIVVKIASANPNMILYGSHYDTKRIPNFVGADDSGSSTGVLLELARLLCARKNVETIWLAFFDGEEAFNPNWADPDNTYGSREMAASLALSGDLRRVKAMILVDMVGPTHPIFKRETNSTPWLTDLFWSTAARLGYGNVFVSDRADIEDDHLSFLKREIPSVDIIDLDVPYWHTTQDTLDKVDPRTLAVTGHVLIESLPELEKRVK
ncbi:MAG TPA: M28 family peptidase [Candidatus Acidoferrales bacterium]|nr:M28 family peptidase [Candidatus Acidoferrales bacterium]